MAATVGALIGAALVGAVMAATEEAPVGGVVVGAVVDAIEEAPVGGAVVGAVDVRALTSSTGCATEAIAKLPVARSPSDKGIKE